MDPGLDGLHLDDGVLESLDESFLKEVGQAAADRGLYLEYNFSMDFGGFGIGIQHDLFEAIGEGDIDMKRAYEIIRDRSGMNRINIETELDVPLDDMETALQIGLETVKRSIRYCRDVLGIGKKESDSA